MPGKSNSCSSCVINELHETIIHVQLLMAVKKSLPRIVSDEVNFHLAIGCNVDDVFDKP